MKCCLNQICWVIKYVELDVWIYYSRDMIKRVYSKKGESNFCDEQDGKARPMWFNSDMGKGDSLIPRAKVW